MAIRNIRKNLAGMEDLLQGVGTEEQLRGTSSYVIGKIDLPYAVSSITALQALNVATTKRARVYSTTTEYTDYVYDADNLNGIIPIEGSGTWIGFGGSRVLVNATAAIQGTAMAISGVVRNGTGDFTATFAAGTFPDANYSYSFGIQMDTSGAAGSVTVHTQSATAIRVIVRNASNAATDPLRLSIVCR